MTPLSSSCPSKRCGNCQARATAGHDPGNLACVASLLRIPPTAFTTEAFPLPGRVPPARGGGLSPDRSRANQGSVRRHIDSGRPRLALAERLDASRVKEKRRDRSHRFPNHRRPAAPARTPATEVNAAPSEGHDAHARVRRTNAVINPRPARSIAQFAGSGTGVTSIEPAKPPPAPAVAPFTPRK